MAIRSASAVSQAMVLDVSTMPRSASSSPLSDPPSVSTPSPVTPISIDKPRPQSPYRTRKRPREGTSEAQNMSAASVKKIKLEVSTTVDVIPAGPKIQETPTRESRARRAVICGLGPNGTYVEPPLVDDRLEKRPANGAKYHHRYYGARANDLGVDTTPSRKPTPRLSSSNKHKSSKSKTRAGTPLYGRDNGRFSSTIMTGDDTSSSEFSMLFTSALRTGTDVMFDVDTATTSVSDEEDAFFNRPSVKLPLTDTLKGLLVDDWENITRLSQLVPIPHSKPVNKILDDYLESEGTNRAAGSASRDILEETVHGLRLYFNKALGHILLYRFERPQWHDVLRQIRAAKESSPIRCAGDAYGAEHLARLLCSLEELIAQTNMDQQSVVRLREELDKFIRWFSANYTEYFVSEYATPSQEYITEARSF